MESDSIQRTGVSEIASSEWLSPAEVCKMIPGMTVSRLKLARFNGTGPRYSAPTPRTIVYARSSIIEWLEASSRLSTAEAS